MLFLAPCETERSRPSIQSNLIRGISLTVISVPKVETGPLIVDAFDRMAENAKVRNAVMTRVHLATGRIKLRETSPHERAK